MLCQKKPSRRWKDKLRHWEKIFANHIANKVFIFRIYKELLKLNRKNPFRNSAKDMTFISVKRIYRQQIHTWKDVQYHQPLEKCKLKSQCDISTHLSKWLKWKILMTQNAGKQIEKVDYPFMTGRNVKWYRHSGSFLQN